MVYLIRRERNREKNMTIDRLKEVHGAKPFQPFTIHLADGRELLVDHPEFLARSPSGRTITLYTPEDRMEIIDLLMVVSVSVENGSAVQRKNQDG